MSTPQIHSTSLQLSHVTLTSSTPSKILGTKRINSISSHGCLAGTCLRAKEILVASASRSLFLSSTCLAISPHRRQQILNFFTSCWVNQELSFVIITHPKPGASLWSRLIVGMRHTVRTPHQGLWFHPDSPSTIQGLSDITFFTSIRREFEKVGFSHYASRFIRYMIVRCLYFYWRVSGAKFGVKHAPHFRLLSVLLRNYHVKAWSYYLKTMYLPSFIQAYLSHLKSNSKTVCFIRNLRHKAIVYHNSKTIQCLDNPQESSITKSNTCCLRPHYLNPSTI